MAFYNNFTYTPSASLPEAFNRISNTSLQQVQVYPDEILAVPYSVGLNMENPSNFVNPVGNTCNNIITLLDDMNAIGNNIGGYAAIQTAISVNKIKYEKFYYHTDRISGQIISGLTEPEDLDRTVPYLSIITTISRNLAYIKYVTENIVDLSYSANCFDSLYLSTELSSIEANLQSFKTTMESSWIWGNEEMTIKVTSLAEGQITEIADGISANGSILDTYRSTDEATFVNLLDEVRTSSTSFIGFISQAQADAISTYMQS